MEQLKHECGMATMRLLKPLSGYQEQCDTLMYGLNRRYRMMAKQHNRGQVGAGGAALKFPAEPCEAHLLSECVVGNEAIQDLFSAVYHRFSISSNQELADVDYASKNISFSGEIYTGHLQYASTGKRGLSYTLSFRRQPLARQPSARFSRLNSERVA